MRKLFRFSFLIVPALFLFSLSARSQVFSGIYNFANVTNSSGTTDPTPAPTATGLTFSSFTAVGQTTLNPNAGGRFSFTGHPTGATTASDIFTGSINTNQYYQVTITPTPGYSLDINSIAFTLQRSATGIRQYAVRSSLDYNTNLPAGISPANTDLSVVSTNVFQVSDATSSAEDGSTITLGSSYDAITSAVTFRFYGWNAEASGGTFSIDNVTINGVANAITALPSVTLSVSTNSGTEADATAITVTATASEAVTGNQTIDLGVSGVNITSGDYTLSGGSITILSGQTTGTATFTVVDDNLAEGAETAALTISNPSAGIVLGSTTAQNITITDNDAAPSVSIAAGLDAAEPATNGTFTINLSSPAPAGGLTVTYTLNGSATLNTDYSDALNGSIVIPEGSLNGTITLSVSNDIFIEGTETIGITLSTVSNSFVIGSPNSATINLNDNDNPPVVINEVYGGGGNTGANFKNDFIELYNNSNTAVNLAGWSVQYNSATGTGAWQVTNLTGSIPAHSYYLVQEGAGAGGVADLPTPDATGGIAMAAGSGKVALVNNTTALSGNNPLNSSIVDKVGYGTVAIGFEGTGPAPAPSAINSIQRTPIGSDANQNGTDFTADLPTPKNSVTDITAPLVSVLSPANGAVNVTTASTASITFNENIEKGTGSITLRKTSDGSILKTFDVTDAEVTVAGSSASFLIQGLAFTTSYYLEVSDGAFKDLSGNSFAGFTGNSTWSFTSGNMPLGIVGNLYNFNSCTTGLTDGFSLFSVVGPQVWACTTFGRDAANPPSGSAANGLQINGFSGTNILNEDWLISPAFDLTATNFPLLSFWSRTKFNGAPLQLKVSTNYPGFGNPNNYTWTDLNGKLPGQTSDVWTESNNINLTPFKTANVYFAFVYSSSADDGARWTLDDIQVTNSAVPPPPSLTLSSTDIQFGFAAFGNNVDKSFTVTGNDITGDITLTASAGFTLSTSAGGPFINSLTLTQTAANNVPSIVYSRFSPSQNNLDFTGTITVSTASVSNAILNLKGTSIDPLNTLEIVNWNIEWFGSTTLGPVNEVLQQSNVQTVLQNIGADIYGLVEVVDEAKLATVVGNMPGYSYVISNYGSHTNTSEAGASPLAEAQKMAFVYKTSVFTNITTGPLVSQGINSVADLTNPAYNYFASGRFPFMMKADVTLNGITKTIRFVLLHAKANTSPTVTSYARRKSGSDTLQYTFNNLYPTDNIILLGDINDDLDQTITDGITPPATSYVAFTTDAVNFSLPTLALSLAGKRSTVSYNDMIDHVIISNELSSYYMSNSASVLTDVASLINNYGSTTSDHYPVFSRFTFSPLAAPLPVEFGNFTVTKAGNKAKINWNTVQELNSSYFEVEHSADSRTWTSIHKVNAAGTSSSIINYEYIDPLPAKGRNYYRIRQVDLNGTAKTTDIKAVDFNSVKSISFFPNPVNDQLTVQSGGTQIYSIRIIDSKGQVVLQNNVNQTTTHLNLKQIKAGLYILQLMTNEGMMTEKFIKQ